MHPGVQNRILIDTALLLAVLLTPWYVTLAVAIFLLALIPSFFEIVIFALLYDVLYSVHPMKQIGLFGYSLIALGIAEFVRALVREKNTHKLRN